MSIFCFSVYFIELLRPLGTFSIVIHVTPCTVTVIFKKHIGLKVQLAKRKIQLQVGNHHT